MNSDMKLEIKNLSKNYGSFCALNNISLSLEQGDSLGLLGPNGAGKTSFIRILAGFLQAQRGDILLNDENLLTKPGLLQKHVGYLPEAPPLYLEMTGLEYLRYSAGLRGMSKIARENKIQELSKDLSIEDRLSHRLGTLSKGYKQRFALAMALLGDPDILILDEPTNGLDPLQIQEFRRTLLKQSKNRITIFSSHILSEIDENCSHVALIHKGRLLDFARREDVLQGKEGRHIILLHCEADIAQIQKQVEDFDPDIVVEAGAQYQFFLRGAGLRERRAKLLKHLVNHQIEVKDYHYQSQGLDGLFAELSRSPKGEVV